MKIQIAQFSGPFELLLSLVDENRLDISEISLSSVTEQYLKYLDALEEERPEELADFLVAGARLLYLKSRKMLPELSPDDEDGPSLENQLRLYKMFVEAAKKLNVTWNLNKSGFFREEPPRPPKEFSPPENFQLAALKESMIKLLYRLTPPKPLPETKIDRSISIKEKMDQIRHWLSKQKSFSFFSFLNDSKNKTEVIAGFLAVLELLKQSRVALKQGDNFSDIIVEKI